MVSDDTDKYADKAGFADGVTFHDRSELDRVQRELREVAGVSALIYEQTCAAEKRRRRKRDTYPDPARSEAATAELKRTGAAAGMLALIGAPQLKNLEIKAAQSDAQVAFAVDDAQLRQFLQTLQQYMPQAQ